MDSRSRRKSRRISVTPKLPHEVAGLTNGTPLPQSPNLADLTPPNEEPLPLPPPEVVGDTLNHSDREVDLPSSGGSDELPALPRDESPLPSSRIPIMPWRASFFNSPLSVPSVPEATPPDDLRVEESDGSLGTDTPAHSPVQSEESISPPPVPPQDYFGEQHSSPSIGSPPQDQAALPIVGRIAGANEPATANADTTMGRISWGSTINGRSPSLATGNELGTEPTSATANSALNPSFASPALTKSPVPASPHASATVTSDAATPPVPVPIDIKPSEKSSEVASDLEAQQPPATEERRMKSKKYSNVFRTSLAIFLGVLLAILLVFMFYPRPSRSA